MSICDVSHNATPVSCQISNGTRNLCTHAMAASNGWMIVCLATKGAYFLRVLRLAAFNLGTADKPSSRRNSKDQALFGVWERASCHSTKKKGAGKNFARDGFAIINPAMRDVHVSNNHQHFPFCFEIKHFADQEMRYRFSFPPKLRKDQSKVVGMHVQEKLKSLNEKTNQTG